jgi:hypothetical protein
MKWTNPDARVIAEAEARGYIQGQTTGPTPASDASKSSHIGGVSLDGSMKFAGISGLTSTADPFYSASSSGIYNTPGVTNLTLTGDPFYSAFD